jgi:hypothetical protein
MKKQKIIGILLVFFVSSNIHGSFIWNGLKQWWHRPFIEKAHDFVVDQKKIETALDWLQTKCNALPFDHNSTYAFTVNTWQEFQSLRLVDQGYLKNTIDQYQEFIQEFRTNTASQNLLEPKLLEQIRSFDQQRGYVFDGLCAASTAYKLFVEHKKLCSEINSFIQEDCAALKNNRLESLLRCSNSCTNDQFFLVINHNKYEELKKKLDASICSINQWYQRSDAVWLVDSVNLRVSLDELVSWLEHHEKYQEQLYRYKEVLLKQEIVCQQEQLQKIIDQERAEKYQERINRVLRLNLMRLDFEMMLRRKIGLRLTGADVEALLATFDGHSFWL